MAKRHLLPYSAAVVILFCTAVYILFKFLPDDDQTVLSLLESQYLVEDVDYEDALSKEGWPDKDNLGLNSNISKLNIRYPIILWWNPLTGERGKLKSCGGEAKCLFTTDRHLRYHPRTKVFMFYGTDFDKDDLPLPREAFHEWGLYHEESPKNNYMLAQEDVITLFNHTATFQRTSHYPLTSQYLKELEALSSEEFFVPLEMKKRAGLAAVVYIHSDCDPPSDRDTFVAELSKHIEIDCYGKCLHNKDLPLRLRDPLMMDDEELYQILARYRFTLSIENAICDDYITEKLWRPLALGSVPIYRGSPSVRDWLPDNRSAILVDDFADPEELAKYLKFLMENDSEYEKYLAFRRGSVDNERLKENIQTRGWGVNDFTRMNAITGFECFVCDRVHQNLKRGRLKKRKNSYLASREHLDCPRPEPYKLNGRSGNAIRLYQQLFDRATYEAKTLKQKVVG